MFLFFSCFFVFLLFCLDSVSVAIGKVQIMYDFMTNSRFHLFHLMGSDISSWRMSIGLFYGVVYGAVTKRFVGKISFNFIFLFRFLFTLRKLLLGLGAIIYNLETSVIVWLLLVLSDDIESNPGPYNIREHSVSILHCKETWWWYFSICK